MAHFFFAPILLCRLASAFAVPLPSTTTIGERDDTTSGYVDKAKQLYQTNPGAVVGIALGCAALVGLLLYYWWRRRRRRRAAAQDQMAQAQRADQTQAVVEEQLYQHKARHQQQLLNLLVNGGIDQDSKLGIATRIGMEQYGKYAATHR